jgi:hypothetical protein
MAFNLIKKMEKMKPKQAMKIRNSIQSLFQSAYWHELGSAFENSLERLAESDKYADEVLSDWKKMLAGHIRATFKRHTEKLIYNPKNLKAYENGRRFLENAIFNDLLKEKA